jgi:uncharacterized protein (TIGR02145 family)
MPKRVILITITKLIACTLFAQQYGSLKDIRDGRVYKTVKIGDQVWMAENLNVSKFRNGDPIKQVKTDDEWERASLSEQPAWSFYANNLANGEKYGKIYNWYAVHDKRGLAPKGWKIPSENDWSILYNYLGGSGIADVKLKSKNGWKENGNGSDSSGFSALPGGYRYYGNESFFGIGYLIDWWTSEQNVSSRRWQLEINHTNSFKPRYRYTRDGLYVRCVKE